MSATSAPSKLFDVQFREQTEPLDSTQKARYILLATRNGKDLDRLHQILCDVILEAPVVSERAEEEIGKLYREVMSGEYRRSRQLAGSVVADLSSGGQEGFTEDDKVC